MKREAGVNPARTRHRILQAEGRFHWETGKETDALEQSAGRPAFRSTGTLRSCHEELAVQNRKADILPTAGEMVFFVRKYRKPSLEKEGFFLYEPKEPALRVVAAFQKRREQ